jgi:undecaprenyl-diphosphatase
MTTAAAATFLGIVQGVTEFLPVSSTAHLLVLARVLGFDDPDSVFTEMIQFGSILAIVWLYRVKLLEVLAGLRARWEARRFALLLVVAFLPAGIVGGLTSGFIERVLHTSGVVIAAAFVAGGLGMLAVERFGPQGTVRRVDDVTLAQALGVGLCQMLALVPGVSRSGATIIGGMLVGFDRATAAEFSFFVAMPTMAAAFVHSALELRSQITADRLGDIAIGFGAAFIASLVVVRPFLDFVRRRGFAPFAWYRIAVGFAMFAAMAAGWGSF